MTLKADILRELDGLMAEGTRLDATYEISRGTVVSKTPEVVFRSFATSAFALIERVAGKSSEFYSALPKELPNRIRVLGLGKGYVVPIITGALSALRKAVDGGLLVRLEDRLRANVYDDFLVQAATLLKADYHVAAMVLVGGVLEDHLRKLFGARSPTWKGDPSLSKYNDALYGAKLYAKTVLSRIQAIAHVRNEAAHGNGAAVKRDDVEDALAYVRRFLTDYPA